MDRARKGTYEDLNPERPSMQSKHSNAPKWLNEAFAAHIHFTTTTNASGIFGSLNVNVLFVFVVVFSGVYDLKVKESWALIIETFIEI